MSRLQCCAIPRPDRPDHLAPPRRPPQSLRRSTARGGARTCPGGQAERPAGADATPGSGGTAPVDAAAAPPAATIPAGRKGSSPTPVHCLPHGSRPSRWSQPALRHGSRRSRIAASIAAHAIVLAIHFSPFDFSRFKDKGPALEVALVNAKSQTRPVKADILAQANLDGGGNTDAEAPREVPAAGAAARAAAAQRRSRCRRRYRRPRTRRRKC